MYDLMTLLGRLAMSAIFAHAAWGKVTAFGRTADMMGGAGMPLAPLFLAGAIALLAAGSLSLALGYRVRWGAAALIAFLVPATLIFHRYWAVPEDQVRMQQIQFMKNLALVGGLLVMLVHDPGRWSLQYGRRGRPRR